MNLSPGLATGSSPLTRGKPEDELVAGLSDRLIPAHAGKTSTTQNVPLLLRAHPRSRGENGDALGDVAGDDGSSPAHAGKTYSGYQSNVQSTAHPRSRGENLWYDYDAEEP